MYLDSNKTIQVKLNTAPSTECQIISNYFDKTSTSNTLLSSVGYTSGTSLATLIAAPTGTVQRAVQNFYVFNPNTGSVQATIIHNYDSVVYTGWMGTLASNQTLQWDNKNNYSLSSNALGMAGGDHNDIQFNNSGSFDGVSNVHHHEGDIALYVNNNASAPLSNHTKLFCKNMAGRNMPAFIGPNGFDTVLQPSFSRNKIGLWVPPGNATTVPGVLGFTAYTTAGNVTLRTVATTNMFTRGRRLGLVSVNGNTGSLVSARADAAQITLGDVIGDITCGGFHKGIIFGVSDASGITGSRTFVGISSSTSAPTNVNPSTLTNVIGIGHGEADSNMKIYYGGSVAQTPIDLGSGFPTNTASADIYDFQIFNPPGLDTWVGYRVERINTGQVVSGIISGNPGTQLPAKTTLLSYSWLYRTNHMTSGVVALDIFQDYIETDY